jgi:hypothetical protein
VDLNCNPETQCGGAEGVENEEKGEAWTGLSQVERRKLSKKLSKKRKREKTQ